VVRRFWVHSIATATLARRFAPAFGVESELAYVASLTHDLGRSALLAAHGDRYSRLACSAHESTEAILSSEQGEFGMTHCRAGQLLSRAWRLPEPFQSVMAHHHKGYKGHAEQAAIGLVQLSCRLADDLMYQAIHRSDIRKPEATIEQFAPRHFQDSQPVKFENLSAEIDEAIQELDF
jgi:HD-like signal output (HDOD) protein